ncbi:hypothetical protein [Streptomyces sp. NPDC058623]|uniref:hypothetical protein n=1 Tax=Streptomyces sp. NPDC058623 TaxID=3346563 RepID=UPI0036603BB7
MEKIWFEVVFRRRSHPVLRVLGNLVWGALAVITAPFVVTGSDSAWRWFIVPSALLILVSSYRGVVVAMQDLRQGAAFPREDAA